MENFDESLKDRASCLSNYLVGSGGKEKMVRMIRVLTFYSHWEMDWEKGKNSWLPIPSRGMERKGCFILEII